MYIETSSPGSQVSRIIILCLGVIYRMLTVRACSYLHINGFIHRDVKAANLLIDDDGTVLLGDLGVAANLAEDPSQHNHELHPHNFRHTATAALSQSQAQVPHPTTSSQGSGSGSGAHGSKRVVIAPGSIAPGRPKMGKRKSFVGTVR